MSYVFLTYKKKIFNSVGLGNTFIYSLGTKNTIYNDSVSVEDSFSSALISSISPDIYYRIDAKILKGIFFNTLIDFRKEPLISSNYAIYGKLGFSYILE